MVWHARNMRTVPEEKLTPGPFPLWRSRIEVQSCFAGLLTLSGHLVTSSLVVSSPPRPACRSSQTQLARSNCQEEEGPGGEIS
eukprot:3072051-Amphidinium_carterae.1